MPPCPVTGFVLAGGRSTRMGRDKALLDWRGRTMLDHMSGLLRSVANPVHVVGRSQLPDRLPDLGPLSGIATALEATSTDPNIIVAVDLPYLTRDFMKYLKMRLENSSHPLLACRIGPDFPLCLGIWRPMLTEIQRLLAAGQLSVRRMIESSSAEIISEDELIGEGFTVTMFRNINTPEDYKRGGGK
jgi:molybdopterin-guanine dinucleotide biosynthesis protein A